MQQAVTEVTRVTHGQPIAKLALPGFTITEASYEPGRRVPRHEHAFASWTLVLEGALEESFDSHTQYCVAGSLLAKPASAAHGNRYGPAGARCLLIELTSAEWNQGEAHDEVRQLAPAHALRAGRVHATLRRATGLALSAQARLEIEDELFAVAADSRTAVLRARRALAGRPWLRAVRDRLAAEFAQPPSMSELAASAGVHPVYLGQAFRAAFATSPGRWVRQRRVEYARHALLATDAPLGEVALRAGYSDQSHFTRRFHAATGATPAAFRAAGRLQNVQDSPRASD
jgi:AraC family transcriptional regulator